MLGLVDNQVVLLEPVLDTHSAGRFRVTFGINGSGDGRVYVYPPNQGQYLETGVTYFVMDGKDHITLDPRTGRFKLKRGKSAQVRAIFAGQHHDLELGW